MEKGAVYSSRTSYDPFTKLTFSPVWCSSQYMTKNSTKQKVNIVYHDI